MVQENFMECLQIAIPGMGFDSGLNDYFIFHYIGAVLKRKIALLKLCILIFFMSFLEGCLLSAQKAFKNFHISIPFSRRWNF